MRGRPLHPLSAEVDKGGGALVLLLRVADEVRGERAADGVEPDPPAPLPPPEVLVSPPAPAEEPPVVPVNLLAPGLPEEAVDLPQGGGGEAQDDDASSHCEADHPGAPTAAGAGDGGLLGCKEKINK